MFPTVSLSDPPPPGTEGPSPRWESAVRWGAAALSGVLLGVSFPTPAWSGLAWVAPGLLWLSMLGAPPRRAMALGCVSGGVQSLIALRWLLHIPFPAGAVAGWLALSAYLSLYAGVWAAWVSWTLKPTMAAATTGETSSRGVPWSTAARACCSLGWWRRTGWLMTAAAAWVALEMLQARLLTGFSWNGLGVTQWRNGPLIQLASITGVYGISFVVCWASLALASAVTLVFFRPALRFAWMAEGRLPLVLLLILVGWGFNRMMSAPRVPEAARTLSMGLVQPSIPQQLIWNDSASPERFEKARRLSSQALATRPEVLVWPEGFLPAFSETQLAEMTRLVGTANAWWIFGADDADPAPPPGSPAGTAPNAYNAAVLASPAGRYERVYRKRHLVLFGEYIPLARQFPFLKSLIPIGDGFAAGAAPVPFPVQAGSGIVTVSPVICFEDIFPHHIRDQIRPETDVLLELTNDGWFGESGAQWQHCANAAFRAVENGLPLVRCANNGITCWIDAQGRLRDVAGGEGGDVYGAGFLRITIPLTNASGTHREPTWYWLHGDVFGWTCVAAAGWRGARRFKVQSPKSKV